MEEKNCPVCNKVIEKLHNKFCSRKCASRYRYLEYISKWKNGLVDGGSGNWGEVSDNIRKYLHEKTNSKCSICDWGEVNPFTNKVPLEIDHIDGNPLNHSESNLRLICPNCHSLTKNYRGRNAKKGEVVGRGYKVSYTDRTKRNDVKELKSLKDVIVECKFCNNNFTPKTHTQKFCNNRCAKQYRSMHSLKPPKDVLEPYINQGYSMRALGLIYGVSDITIKKWLKSYGLVAKTSHKKNIH